MKEAEAAEKISSHTIPSEEVKKEKDIDSPGTVFEAEAIQTHVRL